MVMLCSAWLTYARRMTASGQTRASFWGETLAPYATPDVRRGVIDVATSAASYLVVTALMYAVRGFSLLLMLSLSVLAAGLLLRTFIVFHDCAHGSLFPWRRVNT